MGALDGRNAIVTGSGLAVATALADEGARVLVNDLYAAAAAAASIGEGAIAFAGDLTEEGAPDQLVGTAVDAFGSLEIVVKGAGSPWGGPLRNMEARQFQAMLDIYTVVPFPGPQGGGAAPVRARQS